MLIGLDQPDMVDALVLVGGSSRGGDVRRRIEGYTAPDLPAYHMAHMRELFAPGFFETTNGRWVQALFGATSNNLSGRCIAEIFRARGSCDMTERLPEIKPATLVINGEHDGSMEGGIASASRIPGAQHFILPATGHACCIEDPQTFDARMLQFLRDTAV
jgi:pimeloyl-ACP methyl ester carboxylesterase